MCPEILPLPDNIRCKSVTPSPESKMEIGPTIVGDGYSDPELMEHLGARKMNQLGNDFPEYRTEDPPRLVLNKLAERGYRVVAMAGIGQTCIWTLYKQDTNDDC